MLSSSLISTYDGIVGYWDGVPLRNPKPMGTTDSDIKYLSTSVRSNLIDSMLFPDFTVTGKDGHATMHAAGHAIVKLHRPEQEVFRQQLKMVRAYADLRDDRIEEILVQTEDLLSFYGMQMYLSAQRNAKTMALLYAANRVAVHVEMPIKHFCRSARPIDYATHIQPMIQTPDHSSYPSGHAIEVFATSTVLARVMTGMGPKAALSAPVDSERGRMAGMAFRLAHRIASNRSVAGVHFPVDNASGAVIGCLLGEALYRVATGTGGWPKKAHDIKFKAQDPADPPFDLTLRWLKDHLPDDAADGGVGDEKTIFGKLWHDAAKECEEAPA
ncbi:MAG: phosphatase PAP2 family protein [Paracoccaceae bacterium]